MDATKYGNALEFDVDLHSIYAAYLGLFEAEQTEWWDKSWGGYFTTFNDFLGFGWEVMVVVDSGTGRPHIAVRPGQIALFAKMIRTRFGESLPRDPPTTLPLQPVATRTLSLRRMITISDLTAYRKLSQTLPAAEMAYLRSRVKAGDVGVIEQLFYAGGPSSERERGGVGVRDNNVGYTWAAVNTTWWEKGGAPAGLVPGSGRTGPKGGKGLVLEVGMAVLRCANLRGVGVWPPTPEENYRKSHLIAEEWVDKVGLHPRALTDKKRSNSNPPNYPRNYAFGKSRFVAEKDIEKIVDAELCALASYENDSAPNTLIIVTVGDLEPLPVPVASTLPPNILYVDVLGLEHSLLRRAQDAGVPGTPDRRQPLESLSALLQLLQIPVPPFAPLGNAGNDAYYTLLAFQKLIMAETRLPDLLFRQADPYGFYPPPQLPFAPHHRSTSGPPVRPASLTGSRPGSFSSNEAFGSSRPGSYHSLAHAAFPVQRTEKPNSPRRASDYDRHRPTSISDARFAGGQDHGEQGYSRPKQRQQVTRSQTVFWDDAEFADESQQQRGGRSRESMMKPQNTGQSRGSDPRGQSRPSAEHANGRPRSIEADGTRDRSRPPPSAMKHGSNGLPRPQSHVRLSTEGSRSRLAVDQSGKDAAPRRPAAPSNKIDSGSSTKLSSGSETKPSSSERVVIRTPDENPAKPGKNDKKTLKNEKSVRGLAKSISKFWVG